MEIIRSIPIIIHSSDELRRTVIAFGDVKRFASEVAYNNGKPLRYLELYRAIGKQAKGRVNSQMTTSALNAVTAAYQAAKSCKHKISRPFIFVKNSAIFSIGIRGRDASLKENGIISIWTVDGRKRFEYHIPEQFREQFRSAKVINSLTISNQKNGSLKSTLQIALEVPEPQLGAPIGVDLNVSNAVVAVNIKGEVLFISGKKVKVLNKRTRKTTKRLQKKLATHKAEKRSTRSVRRVLKRLGRKRSRRTLDFCRVTAKKLIEWAGPNSTIVLENLKFDKRKKKSKAINRKLSEWPFGLMRTCVQNRGELVAVSVTDVNPALTSQTCSVCGNFGERKRHKFSCQICNHKQHADINAAINIRKRYMPEPALVSSTSMSSEAMSV